MTLSHGFMCYHQPFEAVDVTQSQGDVDEHDGIADHYSSDITVALSVDFILDASLGTEGYGQVGVFEVLHKVDESEMRTKKCWHTQTVTSAEVTSCLIGVSLFFPRESFAHSDGVVQVIVEWKGDNESSGVVVVCVCNGRKSRIV